MGRVEVAVVVAVDEVEEVGRTSMLECWLVESRWQRTEFRLSQKDEYVDGNEDDFDDEVHEDEVDAGTTKADTTMEGE